MRSGQVRSGSGVRVRFGHLELVRLDVDEHLEVLALLHGHVVVPLLALPAAALHGVQHHDVFGEAEGQVQRVVAVAFSTGQQVHHEPGAGRGGRRARYYIRRIRT